MIAEIKLKDKRTGIVKTIEEEWPNDFTIDNIKFQWEEGNCSCDCNRSLLFYEHDEKKELPCNDGENLIMLLGIEIKQPPEIHAPLILRGVHSAEARR